MQENGEINSTPSKSFTASILCTEMSSSMNNQSHVGLKATWWCYVDDIDYLRSINPHAILDSFFFVFLYVWLCFCFYFQSVL